MAAASPPTKSLAFLWVCQGLLDRAQRLCFTANKIACMSLGYNLKALGSCARDEAGEQVFLPRGSLHIAGVGQDKGLKTHILPSKILG